MSQPEIAVPSTPASVTHGRQPVGNTSACAAAALSTEATRPNHNATSALILNLERDLADVPQRERDAEHALKARDADVQLQGVR